MRTPVPPTATARRRGWVVLCAALAACSSDPPAAGGDARVAPTDLPAEAAAPDVGMDAPALDVGMDAPTPDAAKDATAPDAAPDAAKDATADAEDAVAPCAAGEVRCGDRCVLLSSDTFHCGACGTQCPMGQRCAGGRCECPSGAIQCGGMCTSAQTDPAHCGACGVACATGQRCVDGACVCPTGSMLCGSACVPTDSNEMNCGMCGRVCAAGQSCAAGACVCPTGQTACGEGAATACVNVQTDNAHCGACGNACPAAQRCVDGRCACPAGETACGAGAALRCVDVQADDAHCGACGSACTGGARCDAGSCACPAGETRCGAGAEARCVNAQTDGAHCGACGRACPTGQVCNAGVCQLTCADPLTRCGAGATQACVNLQGDADHCGACAMACAAAPNTSARSCVAGACRAVCASDFGDCDGASANGCEVDLATAPDHCGACGRACPATAPNAGAVACVAGACRATCVADTAALRPRDCDGMAANGCEANVLTDASNCGACGTRCAAGLRCEAGACVARSCRELHEASPALPSGEYDVDFDGPGGAAPHRVYCDMATDGGGWTLVAYASLDNVGYSFCSGGRLRNIYSLARGGGVYVGRMRTGSASLPAVPLARVSTEILFGRSSTMGYSGEIRGMTAAVRFPIPNPATVNFLNASPFAPGVDRGACTAVTLTTVVGPMVTGQRRYTFANALSVSWGDAYPTAYGAFDTSNCINGGGPGPAFANEYSGSFNTRYNPNGYCGSTGPDLEQGTYFHHGWWDADAWMQTGTASIWLR